MEYYRERVRHEFTDVKNILHSYQGNWPKLMDFGHRFSPKLLAYMHGICRETSLLLNNWHMTSFNAKLIPKMYVWKQVVLVYSETLFNLLIW